MSTAPQYLEGHGEYDAGMEPPDTGPKLVIQNAGTIQPEPVDWLWRNRIPVGNVTALAGDGGLGKSTLAIHIAAQVTQGTIVGRTGTRRVAILLCEDSPGSVIQPRLSVAGADLSLVDIISVQRDGISGPLTLPEDLGYLRSYADQYRPELLIADPVMGLLGGGIDAHRDGGKGGMRSVLGPMHRIAEDIGTTVIAVFHLNKGSGPSAQRIGGSASIRNATRNVLMFAAHPEARESGDDDGRRLIGHEKSNYGELQPTLDASIESAGVLDPSGVPVLKTDGTPFTTGRVVVAGDSDVDYRDAMASASSADHESSGADVGALDEAIDFVQGELEDGPMPSRALEAHAKDAGIATRTLQRARTTLGVKSIKTANGWAVHLPGGVGGLGGLGNVEPSPPSDTAIADEFKAANSAEPLAALAPGSWEDAL